MRRGQLLSMDALVSIVLIIMVLGTVSATSENLRGEITSLIGWYERANIAENMLDVLTKSPGESGDWYLNASAARVIGLRSLDKPYALSYRKLMVLNSARADIAGKLANLAGNKDFMIEAFISKYNVSIEGRFPRIYLDEVTFSKDGNPVRFDIQGSASGNSYFSVNFLNITRGTDEYINDAVTEITDNSGQIIPLYSGDIVEFVTTSVTYITSTQADVPPGICNESLSNGQTCVVGPLPPGTAFRIYIKPNSNFQIQMDGKNNWQTIRLTSGQGQVVVTVSAYDSQLPQLTGNYTPASIFEALNSPVYSFAVINGSVVTDGGTISASMERSPWIEVERRIGIVERLEYNLSASPSTSDPMVYGTLKTALPAGAYLKVTVQESDAGNMSFVAVSGAETRGLLIYRNDTGERLKAILVYNNKTLWYSGNNTSVSIPLTKLFDEPQPGETLGLWLYSLSGWSRSSVLVEFAPDLRWDLEPRMDAVVIKLWVWDDS